jgi:hypothetical protein
LLSDIPGTIHGVKTKTCGITARVTQTFYDAFAAKAAEVSGRSPSEYARELLERAVYGESNEVKLMAELLALRRIVVRGLLFPEVEMNRANVEQLLAETDDPKIKTQKALTRLGLAS